MAKTILFHCSQMESLAHKIWRESDGNIDLGVIDWLEFGDGFPNLFIREVEQVDGNDVVFLASFDTTGDIFRQLAVLYALPWYGARSLQVFLPYFPTGTMERVDEPGQVATAKTLARQLSVIPPCLARKSEIFIFDIHALQEWHYFGDQVAVRLLSGIPLAKSRMDKLPTRPVIVFPDEGARKRFARMFKGYTIVTCEKRRVGTKRKIVVQDGAEHVRGEQCVIVDDLGQTGVTLLACQKALHDLGGETHAFVTHGIFPRNCWQQFVDSGFTSVWITDSCPFTAHAVAGQAPFEVLSLASLIAQQIKKGNE